MTRDVAVRRGDASGASSDEQLIALWLADRPASTQRAYDAAIEGFRGTVPVALEAVTLADLRRYASELEGLGLRPGSRRLHLSAVKSLLTFGERLGYLPFNVGGALRLPPASHSGEQRILERDDVWAMITGEDSARNQLVMRMLYLCGLRVEELCALSWGDVTTRQLQRVRRLQLTVHGKGDRVRAVLLPERLARDLARYRGRAMAPGTPVFSGRRSERLNQREVRRIVAAAAARVGVKGAVSPHWLRHCHISHAIEAGAPLHVIQATVGHASLATTGVYAHARPSDSSGIYLEEA